MAKAKPRGCGSCRFADWRRGGPRRAGDCTWREPEVELPDSITRTYFFTRDRNRNAIWKGDGEECPCWQPIEEEITNG